MVIPIHTPTHDYEATHALCRRTRGIERPIYIDLKRFLPQVATSLRFAGALNVGITGCQHMSTSDAPVIFAEVAFMMHAFTLCSMDVKRVPR